MIPLPQDKTITTKELNQIYNNTVATYKFYWFVSILDILVHEKRRKISFYEIIVGMIAEAWYPIHYFRLSFGKSDSLYQQIIAIQQVLEIPIDAPKEVVKSTIYKNINSPRIKSILKVFTLNVPYRFLSPWIKYTSDFEVAFRSQNYTNNCIYAIHGEHILINPIWESYLNDHYLILRDFTFWNLTFFIQKRNPNVPDIPSKLIKPISRDSLTRQHQFWDSFIEIKGSLPCIYTGKILHKKDYDLDHFVPWSFVSHNLLWNLLPSDSSINSSKSNRLPKLDLYLPSFAKLHHDAIETVYEHTPNHKILEDYLTIYDSIPDLIGLDEEGFYQVYYKTFSPMIQIAENMGYSYWDR